MLFSDGANVLYDYADRVDDKQLRLLILTEVATGQRVFHEVIIDYLQRITFGEKYASELILPVTKRKLLRVVPSVAHGDPLFIEGGAPLSAVRSRWFAGEPLPSIADDYDVPVDDLSEALQAIWPGRSTP